MAWSSGVTGTTSIAAHLHPRKQAVTLSIAVELGVYKLICAMAVLHCLVRWNRGRFVPVRD